MSRGSFWKLIKATSRILAVPTVFFGTSYLHPLFSLGRFMESKYHWSSHGKQNFHSRRADNANKRHCKLQTQDRVTLTTYVQTLGHFLIGGSPTAPSNDATRVKTEVRKLRCAQYWAARKETDDKRKILKFPVTCIFVTSFIRVLVGSETVRVKWIPTSYPRY